MVRYLKVADVDPLCHSLRSRCPKSGLVRLLVIDYRAKLAIGGRLVISAVMDAEQPREDCPECAHAAAREWPRAASTRIA